MCTNLFIFVYFFHTLIFSPNAHNSQSMSKLETWSFIQISDMGGKSPNTRTVFGCSQNVPAGSWMDQTWGSWDLTPCPLTWGVVSKWQPNPLASMPNLGRGWQGHRMLPSEGSNVILKALWLPWFFISASQAPASLGLPAEPFTLLLCSCCDAPP